MKTATQILRQRRPRSGFVFRHGSAIRRQRRVAGHGLEERDLREVSAYSTVCPEPAREAAYSQRPVALIPKRSLPRHSIRQHWKMKTDRPPRFRKTCNLPVPPRLPTASCPSTRVSISVGNAPNPKSFSRPPHLNPSSLPGVHLLASSVCRDRRLPPYFSRLTTTRRWSLAREISTQNRRAHVAMSFNPVIARKRR